jgi:hypothetical protein
MRETPGGIQQCLSLVTSPLAPRVVPDHRQVKGDVAFFGRGSSRGKKCIVPRVALLQQTSW